MLGGLPLVVALLPYVWVYCSVCDAVLSRLLRSLGGQYGHHLRLIFQLHGYDLPSLFLADRYKDYIVIVCLHTYLSLFNVVGTVGFFSCLYFNYQIYGSIKVD